MLPSLRCLSAISGSAVNFSGQLYKFVAYGVSKENEHIDYNHVAEVAKKEKPKMITVGASAYRTEYTTTGQELQVIEATARAKNRNNPANWRSNSAVQ